ncbi:membrane protein [Campylobacter jejuni]|uniref:membrane protein n=1 Tax=Campylobacter jejuni TaxID=197 RepID=UPI0005768CD2|nr:membrane protein [Campylobacter jejuni]
MLNWKKIQELNLKEVAAKTQIELDFLEALAEKNFTVLSRFNVKGFVKILSREYELDFSDFHEEYEAYLNENNPTPQKKSKVITPKLDAYSQKSSNAWPFLIVLIILVIIVSGIYYFDTLKTFFKNEQNSTSVTVIDIIGQAQENLKSLDGNNVVVIDNNKVQETNQTDSVLPSQNIVLQENDQNISTDNNISENNTTLLNEEKNIQIKENINTPNNDSLKEAHFKTSAKIWIGLIDLKNFKKTSFVKEKDFNVSLDKDQLILTGAAALTMFDQENKEQKFPAGISKRFLIKDGKITNISATEFVKLNKGKEW